jgi:AcrR family transcriptional regulator
LHAALTEFAEQGFDTATMDDIAARAGVAHGTVYRYFANKEAVLLAVVAEKLTALAEAVGDALTDPSEEGVALAIRRFFAHVSANRDLARVWAELAASRSSAAELRMRLRSPFIDAISTKVRQAQLSGSLPAEVDVDVAARALGAMVDNFAFVWFVLEDRPGDDSELDRLAATLATLWSGALGKGQQADDERPPLRAATGR